MLLSRVMVGLAGLLALVLCLGGCIPGEAHVDEEKDPHFQRGINLVNGQDYKGAAEEFEKALETNPRSAAAHFELACLYDTKLNDGAAAIYHYERHLQLLTNSEHATLVKQRIHGCKQELANTEFLPPNSQNLQREVDRLTMENMALKGQLAAARQHPAPAQAEVVPGRAQVVRLADAVPPAGVPLAPPHPKVHVVKERETISAIAAQYGLKSSAVLAANPRVDPRRLRVGQSLNLP